MTAFPRCPECNGQRVPMNYVGDVVGAVCYCGFARRAEPSTSFEDVYRTQTAEITRLRAEVDALKAEDARLRKTWQKENDELVQILGKALQYPRFVDDQSVFPGATEADGVCVPCHTALSIADEAAEKIEALKAELARLTPMMRLEPTGWEFLDWIEPDFLTSIPQGTQLYMIDAARAAQGVE